MFLSRKSGKIPRLARANYFVAGRFNSEIILIHHRPFDKWLKYDKYKHFRALFSGEIKGKVLGKSEALVPSSSY